MSVPDTTRYHDHEPVSSVWGIPVHDHDSPAIYMAVEADHILYDRFICVVFQETCSRFSSLFLIEKQADLKGRYFHQYQPRRLSLIYILRLYEEKLAPYYMQ